MITLADRPKTTAPCPDCGVVERVLFYLDATGRKTNARCKPCHRKRCSEYWHSKTRLEKQSTRVRAMYGIEPDEYIAMYNAQNGRCAICGKKPTTKRGLHVDHCHTTGKVRGLLCHGCNVGLGSLGEDPDILSRAIDYLKET